MLIVVGALGILKDRLSVVGEIDDDGGCCAVALDDLSDDLVIVVNGIHVVADDPTTLGIRRCRHPVGECLREILRAEGGLLVDISVREWGVGAHQVYDLKKVCTIRSLGEGRAIKEKWKDFTVL